MRKSQVATWYTTFTHFMNNYSFRACNDMENILYECVEVHFNRQMSIVVPLTASKYFEMFVLSLSAESCICVGETCGLRTLCLWHEHESMRHASAKIAFRLLCVRQPTSCGWSKLVNHGGIQSFRNMVSPIFVPKLIPQIRNNEKKVKSHVPDTESNLISCVESCEPPKMC